MPITNETVLDAFSLLGRVGLVTGAGGYLGQSMSRALAEAGCRVIATSRYLERAAAVAAALPDPYSVGHIGLPLDHLDPKAIDQCIAKSIDTVGQIDVLVNNAHDFVTSDWTNINAEEFNQQLSNATAYFLLARHVRNLAVRRQSSASIIMLGSMYGLVGSYPDAYRSIGLASPVAYHALKGGIIHLTRHLAVYWAKDNVRVNCLSPGPFPSATANPEMVERLIAKSLSGRMGHPHELMGPLLLLASDAGSYMTGHNLVVDGGWTAW